MNENSRSRLIKRSSIVSAFGNTILAVLKIVIGLASHSLALVGDGIDSATDIATSLLTFFTASISSEPPDREHPWGHERAETISTKILSFIIFFAGGQLAVKSVQDILSGSMRELPGLWAIYATLFSIAGKTILALYKFNTGKKTDSPMLIADGKNMRNDIIISLTVLIGLLFTRWFNIALIDSVIALIVSFWIMVVAFSIFRETSLELMDSIDDKEIYNRIFAAVERVQEVQNPHKMRIRKMNRFYVVDLDVEVDGNLTVKEGHDISLRLDEEIRSSIDNIYDIMIHIEPAGAGEHKERFGLKKEDLWQ
ncbi:cation diffusion facilitator family transporter [Spirochaeta isovalerica]|uniref:Cation diffusion facilitator family transporter n=1 Tax=Spirochaeta isovalerica TaxID=150 RepID=A0A841R7A4_9SPIO|nr:cation diffusion facilitator family transporter [Spirochaeta isovalerica]MBB6478382.1 cation diffusion facilitator family transporter [Spirochaeta isovalerica]